MSACYATCMYMMANSQQNGYNDGRPENQTYACCVWPTSQIAYYTACSACIMSLRQAAVQRISVTATGVVDGCAYRLSPSYLHLSYFLYVTPGASSWHSFRRYLLRSLCLFRQARENFGFWTFAAPCLCTCLNVSYKSCWSVYAQTVPTAALYQVLSHLLPTRGWY